MEQNNKYCIDKAKNTQKLLVLMKLAPCIILKLFLNMEMVSTSENQRVIFKSLLMPYFIRKQNKSGAE